MGPYCRFCGLRCFVYVLPSWPKIIRQAYALGHGDIAATCCAGQRFEKERLGACYGDTVRGTDLVSGMG